MYNFESEIDAIDGMVREKEYMSNVSDIGKDLEHCKELQHKLSEANTDMTVNQKIQKAKQVKLFFRFTVELVPRAGAIVVWLRIQKAYLMKILICGFK